MFLQSRYKVGLTLRVSWYKVDRSYEFIPPLQIFGRALVQGRDAIFLEVSNLSKCRILLCANAGIRVLKPLSFCLDSRNKSKNCDKPINYTVRVRFS